MKDFANQTVRYRIASFVYSLTECRHVEEKLGRGRRESVTNDVTETNHIWPPSAMEKDQDCEALMGLVGIIIFGKWDSFEDLRTREKRVGF